MAGRWERVVKVFEWFKSQKGYVPNVIHYNVVFRVLGKAQRCNQLRLLWIEMAKNGVSPTSNTYSMLVDVYGKAGLVREALLWIKHMRLRVTATNGSRLIPISFKHFLSTELFKTGGRNILNLSNKEIGPQKPQLTSTFNTLIDLYGKARRLKDAAEVFADMLKSGVAMDTITFNTMIFICGSHGNLLEAESLLNKTEEKGISPDTKTYNILLSLYANSGNTDAALCCYRRIRDVGLFPDDVTHRALLGALCSKNMVQAVEILIDEMEKSSVSVDEHSLPSIIEMYVNEGALDKANDMLQKFLMNGVPSSSICAAIMDAFAEKGHWLEAENVFYWERGVPGQRRDAIEYNVLIKAYGWWTKL
ncbi:hypothetical protein AHAS_Ahas02G0196400 [Arachis hypogaea]